MNKLWMNMDMNDAERRTAGIYTQLQNRHRVPLVGGDDPQGSWSEDYLPHADGVREAYWVSQLIGQEVKAAISICGVAHLSSFARKLRERHCVVHELNVCQLAWFLSNVGRVRVTGNSSGQRCTEFRPANKKGRV
jgi:hypothetical protein